MPRNTRPLRQVQASDLDTAALLNRGYYKESFHGGQQPFQFLTTTGLPVMPTDPVAQGSTVSMLTPGGAHWELFTTTAQSILAVGTVAKGLDIACDAVNNEAVELVPGGNSTKSRFAKVIGTSPDFFMRCTFEITDADGSDQFLMGFRKQQTYGVPTSFLTTGDGTYTDFCGIGFATTAANPNPVKVAYDLNDSGSTTILNPAFTWADTLVHQLEMRVIGRKAYFRINGRRLGASIAFDADGGAITAQQTSSAPDGAVTFDTGDTVIPFIFLRHDTNVAQATYLRDIEIGPLYTIGEDPAGL